MNLERLQQAEQTFLESYPGGFGNSDMVTMGKKHKMEKMISFTQESFVKENFKNAEEIVENMGKVVSRASMVSMFEKPKFRDFIKSLDDTGKESLANALETRLYGDEQEGFETILEILRSVKLAKWPLMTIWPIYFNPHEEAFIKPTTVKGIIKLFDLKSLEYKPAPTWAFYKEYRSIIQEMKDQVDPSLYPDNACFSGFLMMSLEHQ